MIDELTRDERKIAAPPAKRWRNWYMVIIPLRHEDDGQDRDPGYIYGGARLWPSKDVAEQKALAAAARDFAKFGMYHEIHVGAFPEGERP
jgi:hypothetical protein